METNRKIQEFKRVLNIIQKSPVSTSAKYKQVESADEKFAELMRLYSGICTFEKLIKDFNDIEIRKQLKILGISYSAWDHGRVSDRDEEFIEDNVTPILADNVDYYIDRVLNRKEYHDITVHSMSAFIANKIKNKCDDLTEDIFDYYLIGKTIGEDNSKRYILKSGKELDKEAKRKLYSKLRRYISPSVDDDPKDRERLLKSLVRLGIDEEKLEYLEQKCGGAIRIITSMKAHMLSIKDQEIQKTVDLLQKDGTLSYGLLYTSAKGDKYGAKTEPLLVIDLPYYGQFSLHLKAEKSSETALSEETMAELKETPYPFPLYETKTVLLSENCSYAALDIEGLESEELSEKARLGLDYEKEFAHYAALKLGATRADLYQIFGMITPEIKRDESKGDGGRD